MYLLMGVAGFVSCCLFDINKTYWNKRFLNLFFVIGSILLILSSILCILQANVSLVFQNFGIYHLLMLIGLLLSCAAEIYALFFALPFENTYMESTDVPVITQGWYAACRHPGFWPLAFVYLFLWLLFSSELLLYAFIAFTFSNFFYIYIQDKYIFPRYIRGYDDYKKKVPFLIPTKESLSRAFDKK